MNVWWLRLAIVLTGALVGHPFITRAQNAPSRTTGATRSIADAIAQRNVDREVTIAGRVVVAAGKLQSTAFDIAIEDAIGGIRIFSRTPQPDVKEGDSVTATGAVKRYRGDIELAARRVAIIDAPRRIPQPRDLPIDLAIIKQHQGELIRVRGHAGFGRREGGQWLRLRDAASITHSMLTVWVPANHGAPIDFTHVGSNDSLVVTGVVTSYQDNADDAIVWQLVPRDKNDVQISEGPANLSDLLLWLTLAAAVAIGGALAITRLGARRQLRALRETETRYRQLLALLPDAVIVHARGSILFTNPAAVELRGLPSDKALVGRPVTDFVHPDSRAAFTETSGNRAMSSIERTPCVRARMLNASGNVVHVEVTSSPCVYHDRPAMVVLARDITSQLRYERDLHALALVDELTGLQNRRAFTLFAEQELARARRHGRTPVLVFADLDGLKEINDEHGHGAGDIALRIVANALRSIFRETDVVARWSGDEFVALMVEGSEEAAQLIGSRLDAAIALYSPPNLPYIVAASVGASPLDPALPLRDAMERVDAKLYSQKKRGRRSKTLRTTPISINVVKEPD